MHTMRSTSSTVLECLTLNFSIWELIHLAFFYNFSIIKSARILKNRCFVQLHTQFAFY